MNLFSETLRQLGGSAPVRKQRFSLFSATVTQIYAAQPWIFAADSPAIRRKKKERDPSISPQKRKEALEKQVRETLQLTGFVTRRVLAKKLGWKSESSLGDKLNRMVQDNLIALRNGRRNCLEYGPKLVFAPPLVNSYPWFGYAFCERVGGAPFNGQEVTDPQGSVHR